VAPTHARVTSTFENKEQGVVNENRISQGPEGTNDLGTGDLLGGILADVRELLAAHADRLRTEVSGDVRALGRLVKATVVAGAAAMVALTMLGIAIAATLVAVGLPAWLASWIVVVIAGAGAGLLIAKMRATDYTDHVVDEVKAARDDVAWAGKNTVKALEGDAGVEPAPPTHPLH
jgi:hypothetical protein